MSHYRLKVSLVIQQMECFDESGAKVDSPVPGGFERESQYNTLRVEENVELGSRDFMGVCGVLAEMHNAMKNLGKAKPVPQGVEGYPIGMVG